jgi:transcriptional regulator with XRE-family HTH domain
MNKRKNVVPNNLKEFRLKAGLTQKQVAEMLGMQCEDRLSHWEKGQSMPSVKNLFTLAKVYKALPHTLFPNFSDDL